MEISQGELEQRGGSDSLLARPSDIAEKSAESDSEDWHPQDVAGILLGFGVLTLVLLLGVVVSLSVATAFLRHV
jgi:hypothetical protein